MWDLKQTKSGTENKLTVARGRGRRWRMKEMRGHKIQTSAPGDVMVQHADTEKAMAPHSSTLAWKIPWMEEPGGLQSMGLRRVGHN